MITASKPIYIPANKYTDLKVEGINLVFLYFETREFCLINYACVCVCVFMRYPQLIMP